jgi:hypothetical protein
MRMFLTILAMLLFTNSGHSADADRERLDEESLRIYMAGELTSSAARLIRLRFIPAMSRFEKRKEF